MEIRTYIKRAKSSAKQGTKDETVDLDKFQSSQQAAGILKKNLSPGKIPKSRLPCPVAWYKCVLGIQKPATVCAGECSSRSVVGKASYTNSAKALGGY